MHTRAHQLPMISDSGVLPTGIADASTIPLTLQ